MGREGGLCRRPGTGRSLVLRGENPQGKLARKGQIFVQTAVFGVIGHDSRHILSRIMPRRIQLFIVPNGTFSRAARAS